MGLVHHASQCCSLKESASRAPKKGRSECLAELSIARIGQRPNFQPDLAPLFWPFAASGVRSYQPARVAPKRRPQPLRSMDLRTAWQLHTQSHGSPEARAKSCLTPLVFGFVGFISKFADPHVCAEGTIVFLVPAAGFVFVALLPQLLHFDTWFRGCVACLLCQRVKRLYSLIVAAFARLALLKDSHFITPCRSWKEKRSVLHSAYLYTPKGKAISLRLKKAPFAVQRQNSKESGSWRPLINLRRRFCGWWAFCLTWAALQDLRTSDRDCATCWNPHLLCHQMC